MLEPIVDRGTHQARSPGLRDRVRTMISDARDELRAEHGFVARRVRNELTLQVPVRLQQAASLSVRPAVFAAIASSTAIFTATPFLLRPIADEFGVSLGAAGGVSTRPTRRFRDRIVDGGPASADPCVRCSSRSASSESSRTSRAALAPGLAPARRGPVRERDLARAWRRGSPGRTRSATPTRPAMSPRSGRSSASCVPPCSPLLLDAAAPLDVRRAALIVGRSPLLFAAQVDVKDRLATAPDPPRSDPGQYRPADRAGAGHHGRLIGVRLRGGDRHRVQRIARRSPSRWPSARTHWSRFPRRGGEDDAGRPACGISPRRRSLSCSRPSTSPPSSWSRWSAGVRVLHGDAGCLRLLASGPAIPRGTRGRRTGGDGARSGLRSADRRRIHCIRRHHEMGISAAAIMLCAAGLLLYIDRDRFAHRAAVGRAATA